MASDIDNILNPKAVTGFKPISPVICMVWNGKILKNGEYRDKYDKIEFDSIYPFDTIDTIKRMVFDLYKDLIYHPRFLFVGVPLGDVRYYTKKPNGAYDETYHPIDYLWYPSGINDPKQTYKLANPIKNLRTLDNRFALSGNYTTPNYEVRGRSTFEEVFLKTDGKIPVFHVYPLEFLIKEFSSMGSDNKWSKSEESWNKIFSKLKLSEETWNNRFAPYYPNVSMKGPYIASEDDDEFGKNIIKYIDNHLNVINNLNKILDNNYHNLPHIKLNGIRQMMLIWKKPIEGFQGSASLFYQIKATKERPYIRLLPAEGSAITKLHVNGILPIPSLDDPRVIEQWSKESSSTPNIDFCTIKYVHRPSIGITQSIYGTIHVLNDGTLTLQLQPPKLIREFKPETDFRHFEKNIQSIFVDLPQEFSKYEIKEISLIFKLLTKSSYFTKERIVKRLPHFSSFFKEITSLPTDNPIISLRYKAVNQYYSEDKVFTFITQLATEKLLEGEAPPIEIINSIQEEFQLSKKEATSIFAKWFQKKETFTVQLPEDGEFVETFHPGVDIHIYAQHPLYYIHVNRIDNYESYIRIYTLLSILFMDDDSLFKRHIQNAEEVKEAIEDVENPVRVDNEHIQTPVTTLSTSSTESRFNFGELDVVTESPEVEKAAQAAQAAEPVQLAPIPSPIAASAAQQEEPVDPILPGGLATTIKINPNNYFIKKLQAIDSRLFKYKVDGKDNSYARKCGSTDDRQPVVMTQDEFDIMRNEYERDKIFWFVYPIDAKTDPIIPIDTKHVQRVMRYGSDVDKMYYYFCPHYYCIYDKIMILEDDFNGTQDRHNPPRRKLEKTCPFCHGGLITDKKHESIGNTVIKRKDKGVSGFHGAIDFMKSSTHPENFALPCCFLKQSTLRITSPEFSHLRESIKQEELLKFKQNSQLLKLQPSIEEEKEEVEVEDAEDAKDAEEYAEAARVAEEIDNAPENNADTESIYNDFDRLVYKTDDTIEYAVLFNTLHTQYILESNKHPRPGIFAVASEKFDTFFTQNSTESIIVRSTIKLGLKPYAQGFLRIGTQNTIYESLLGVIAPLIFKNTIQEVKETLLAVITPRIFINCHFGNLVLEFYNPADKNAMPPTYQELMSWARINLNITLNSKNLYQLIRIYNSYNRFVYFINDKTQRKDLRHIQPLLSEPGLLTTNGIQLIVMDDNEDSISIRCPIFGVAIDRHKTNDMVFISRSLKKIGLSDNKYAKYELFIHTSNKPAKGREIAIHEHIVKWDYASQRIWPDIVKQRVDEYLNQCQSRYRSIYTSQDINSMSMIPLSNAIESSPFKVNGIVKDNYNHIVAITFSYKGGARAFVALPVIDDGALSISQVLHIDNIYLDWTEYRAAPVEEIISYYKRNIEPIFQLYPGYRVKYIVKQDEQIVAVQLENGAYIPASKPLNQEKLDKFGLDTVTVEEFQWDIDKKLTGIKPVQKMNNWDKITESTLSEKSCGKDPELVRDTTYVDFEETYQQFRLMVSNWITSHDAGSNVRQTIADIIFTSKLPNYEKQKRLYIYLSSTLLSWFYEDSDHHWNNEGSASFLRKDCNLINTPDACNGSCYWKGDEQGGKCLLHVNDKTVMHTTHEPHLVSTSELFTKRIIDELVRFPNRRKQLMKKGEISKIMRTIKPIHIGDQYIIPESSITWTNLLRLDWIKQIAEEPKYYEEMSGKETEVEVSGISIPPSMYEILGDKPIFRLKAPDTVDKSRPLLAFTTILGTTLDTLNIPANATRLTQDNLVQYVYHTSKPIGYIDYDQKEPEIIFVKPEYGIFEHIPIFLFNNDMYLLIENDDSPYIKISSLPPVLLDKWYNAGIVKDTDKVAIREPAEPVIDIGKKIIMAPMPHIPLVAKRVKPKPAKTDALEAPVVPASVKRVKPKPAKVSEPAPLKLTHSVSAPVSVPLAPSASVLLPVSLAPSVSDPVKRMKPTPAKVSASVAPVAPEVPEVPEVPVAPEVPLAPVAPESAVVKRVKPVPAKVSQRVPQVLRRQKPVPARIPQSPEDSL